MAGQRSVTAIQVQSIAERIADRVRGQKIIRPTNIRQVHRSGIRPRAYHRTISSALRGCNTTFISNTMTYFTSDFIEFFKELSRNNHKEWFHDNRMRYEASVKVPFESLVAKLIELISLQDTSLKLSPADAILRINRDIRFSNDKSPYNLYTTAFISAGGRKDKSIPGFFIRLSPELTGVMVGCYGPDKEQLQRIRQAILQEPDRWQQIVSAAGFKSAFGGVRGAQVKRLESPYKEALEKLPVLANKQFYALAELPAEVMLQESLVHDMMQYWQHAREFNQFLATAIKTSR